MRLRLLFAGLMLAFALSPSPAQFTATSQWQNSHVGSGTRNSIAFDGSGNILVTNAYTGARDKSVLGFSPTAAADNSGAPLEISGVGSTDGFPNSLAVNAATGHLYAARTASGTFRVYQYDLGTGDSSLLQTVTPFTVGTSTPFKNLDAFCFSPDGSLLYASFSGSTVGGTNPVTVSIVRVARRGNGDTWTDTGQILAPSGNSLTTSNPDPRLNQGRCFALAADAAGNLWVSSASDPVLWNGMTGHSSAYYVQTARDPRPLRWYLKGAGDTWTCAAEIPLARRATGLALSSDGTLYVAEGRTAAGVLSDDWGAIHVYRGLTRVGTIDTSADGLWNLEAIAVSPGGNPTALGQTHTKVRAMQQWTVSGLPAPPLGTIQGRITDATTGKPIAGATIRIFDQQVATDAFGDYTATIPQTGTADTDAWHIITVEAPGYLQTRRQPVRLAAALSLDLSMAPTTPAASGVSYFVETTLGASDTRMGLSPVVAPDGDSDVTSMPPGGDNARRTGGNTAVGLNRNSNGCKDVALYFGVDRTFLGGNTPAFVTVRFQEDVDNSAGWELRYDAAGNPSRPTEKVVGRAEDRVREASFYLPDANFSGRAGYGADFYLNEANSNALTVQRVAVTRGLPPTVSGAPSGYVPHAFPPGDVIRTAPTVYNNIIWTGVDPFYLVGLDLVTGQPATSIAGGEMIQTAARPVGRPVIFRTPDNAAHVCIALATGAVEVRSAATGALEWESAQIANLRCEAAPVVYVDTSTGTPVPLVYLGATYTDPVTNQSTGRLLRYRPDGAGGALMDLSLNVGTEVTSSPALSAGMDQLMVGYTDGADGYVLITDNPRLSNQTGAFTPRYDIKIPGEPVRASPTLSGDGRTMLIGSSNGVSGHLIAANSSNGGHSWSLPLGGVETTPWVDYEAYGNAAQADTVFATTTDGMIHAIDLNTHLERTGYPLRPVPGYVGGSLMVLNRKLYVGSAIGMLVIDPVNPTDIRLFSPVSDTTIPPSTRAPIAPGFNVGVSASGRLANQSVVALTGSDGKIYEMYVQ